jgi:hypothetical protein
MSNLLKLDYKYLTSKSRLASLAIIMFVTNCVVFGLIGLSIGQDSKEQLVYALAAILVAYVLAPVIKGVPHWIGFHLQLKTQLRLFFLKIFTDNNFPKKAVFSNDAAEWLTQIKLDSTLSAEQRLMAAELLLIIQSIIASNSNLPNASQKIISVLNDSLRDYLGDNDSKSDRSLFAPETYRIDRAHQNPSRPTEDDPIEASRKADWVVIRWLAAIMLCVIAFSHFS